MKLGNNSLLLGSGLLFFSLLFSCTKDPIKNLSNDESRIYITNYDSAVNFSAFATYSISDSVAVIKNGQLQGKTKTEADEAFIQAIKDNLNARGYRLVAKDEQPDLGINVSAIYNNQTGVLSYPSYWGYYNTFWDPYYWGYGGYDYYFPYLTYAVYQITEGALSIDMVDLKNANTGKKIEGIWSGLIRGEGILQASTAASQVKTLFDQSPYLATNSH